MIFISHKLHEVKAVADRVTVLRGGRSLATVATAEATPRSLAALMVGRELGDARPSRRRCDAGRRRARARRRLGARATAARRPSGASRSPCARRDRRGRGRGRQRPARAGRDDRRDPPRRRRARFGSAGKPLRGGDPRAAIAAGVAYVPEDRLGTGRRAEPQHRVEPRAQVVPRTAVVARAAAPPAPRSASRAVELIARYRIAAPGPAAPARLLSGGNLQKVVLAREFSGRAARCSSPRRRRAGSTSVRSRPCTRYLRDAAADGVAVLLISEDLDEILTLADRIAVMYEGAIAGEHDARRRERRGARPADGRGGERSAMRIERRLRQPRWLLVAVPAARSCSRSSRPASCCSRPGTTPLDATGRSSTLRS